MHRTVPLFECHGPSTPGPRGSRCAEWPTLQNRVGWSLVCGVTQDWVPCALPLWQAVIIRRSPLRDSGFKNTPLPSGNF